MAYPDAWMRLTFGGSMADDQEIWSCGLNLSNITNTSMASDVFDDLNTNDDIDDIATLVATMVGSTGARVPNGYILEWVKLALLGPDGKYLRAPLEKQITQAGATGTAYIPQTAVVITLESDRWKDPGKYNRYYLPTAVPTGSLEYYIRNADQLTIAAEQKTMIEGINNILALYDGVDADNEVRVSTVSSSISTITRPVETIRVGNLIDTQRRRRNQIPEVYVSTSVTPV